MSDYGADKNPDLNLATEITKVQKLMPGDKANVMQWTYANGVLVQKYARRLDASNLHVKLQL